MTGYEKINILLEKITSIPDEFKNNLNPETIKLAESIKNNPDKQAALLSLSAIIIALIPETSQVFDTIKALIPLVLMQEQSRHVNKINYDSY